MQPGRRGASNSVRMKTNTEATAYHEAGHALADFRLGFKIKQVSVISDGTCAGFVSRRLGLKLSPLEFGCTTSKTVARWHDHILTLLAGEEAQRRFSAKSVRSHHAAQDRSVVVDVLMRLHSDQDELRAVYRYLQIRARNLVCHPVNWQMIECLAKLLLEKKTLTGQETAAAFRASLRNQMEADRQSRAA